ncbi:MAG: hypothetical protein F4Z60_10480 [Chloroflexi bacterium]|nr:hypothetical protein [Chloroflexota bacterium]
MASYQGIAARYDAANQRLDGLLTLTSTVTLAAPLIVAATGAASALQSPLVVAVACLFAAVLVLGVAGRGVVGSPRLVDPADLYEDWIDLEEIDFELEAVYWAGEHFEHGMRVVWRKSLIAHAMTALFILEVVVLLAWIASDL